MTLNASQTNTIVNFTSYVHYFFDDKIKKLIYIPQRKLRKISKSINSKQLMEVIVM